MTREKLVPAVCKHCGKPMRMYGGPYMAPANPDGTPPVARIYGGYYTHARCPK